LNLSAAIILGLIQGLTEFLPVSSSGHLALAKSILGLDADAKEFTALVVFVHLGTALSVITVYRREVSTMIHQIFQAMGRPANEHRLPMMAEEYQGSKSFRMVVLVAVTLVPTAIAFLFMKDVIETFFDEPKWVGVMLVLTAVLLALTIIRKNPKGKLSPAKAFLVGVAQSFAMLPGISRSGSTIAMALYLNVDREKAANFSFLMALPVILIGAVLECRILIEQGNDAQQWGFIFVATLVAYLSGLLAIRLVLHFVTKGKLQYFAIYCLVVGVIAFTRA